MNVAKRIMCVVIAIMVTIPVFGRKIHLNGDWNVGKKSIDTSVPIEVNVDDVTGDICIGFRENLGVIYVSFINVNGEIAYQEIVDAIRNESKIIPCQEIGASGIILITDQIGNYLYGELTEK